MKQLRGSSPYTDLMKNLKSDCTSCCGLCCFALYFSKLDGFPQDKAPGVPCRNLQSDFRCAVHSELAERGLKGCIHFDCLGAGQRITRSLYSGRSWSESRETAAEMCRLFPEMRLLHQMLWYLIEASTLVPAASLLPRTGALICEVDACCMMPPQTILARLQEGAADELRDRVNGVLKETIALTAAFVSPGSAGSGASGSSRDRDLIGKRFRGKKLDGRDFSAALLIASDLSGCSLRGVSFLGADLRDADLRGADLRDSLFLTPEQLASAKGDRSTRLPPHLLRPDHW